MRRRTAIFFSTNVLLLIMGLLAFLCLVKGNVSLAEGSGDWGTATDRRSWLWVPQDDASSNAGYGNRGYMLLPSTTNSYNPDHRMYVYVKDGETVYWGFRKQNGGNDITVKWFYDDSDTGFFPAGLTGGARTEFSSETYDARSTGGAQGRPADAAEAANGPEDLVGTNGYNAYSFTNDTGEDRAFWVEVSGAYGFNINFWDVTVADASDNIKTGRLYCKFWSIVNGLPNTAGAANSTSFHDDFGFYVPVDDTFGGSGDKYFVKHAKFSNSNGGYVNFFANEDGPRNDQGSHTENRKSITGTSSNYQYPLFLNDPDHEFWPTTDLPTASLGITYEEKVPSGNGGHAWVDIEISLPGIVDVLIDLNGNGVYDTGVDIVLSESYAAPGEYQVYWDGEDANGNIIVSGSTIEVFAAVIFSPVHFPVYDMEQSLGITITNVRPGDIEDNAIYWDDSLIPRDGETGFADLSDGSAASAVSTVLNVTGEAGTSHIWHADGDNGFSQNNTINTWAASYYAEVNEEDGYRYLTFEGNVYDDDDGLDDGLVSGSPTLAIGLYTLIVDGDGLVVASAQVQGDGAYSIDRVPDGSYMVILSTVDAAEGEVSPGPSLPEDWENTGEQLGNIVGENLLGNDGVLEEFSLNNTSVVNANFGLRQLAVLPVIWRDFQVRFEKKERFALLEWIVAKEWLHSHYEIERSEDGIENFEKIGEVSGKGESGREEHYNFYDRDLASISGKVYYRIKQVDLSGEFSFSKVVVTEVGGLGKSAVMWKVYPNPTNGNNISVKGLNNLLPPDEKIRMKLLGATRSTSYVEVMGEEELCLQLRRLIRLMDKGLLILEVQWKNQIEYIKLIYQ